MDGPSLAGSCLCFRAEFDRMKEEIERPIAKTIKKQMTSDQTGSLRLLGAQNSTIGLTAGFVRLGVRSKAIRFSRSTKTENKHCHTVCQLYGAGKQMSQKSYILFKMRHCYRTTRQCRAKLPCEDPVVPAQIIQRDSD
jgi:hypothetical protein